MSNRQSFLLGLLISVVVLGVFFAGGLADRVFVLKPLDWLAKTRIGNSLQITEKFQPNEVPAAYVAGDKTVVDVAEQTAASVVTVEVKQQQRQMNSFDIPFGFGFSLPVPRRQTTQPQEIKQDIGSGFVIDGSGLVVTNKHVVSDPDAEYLIVDKSDKEYKVSKIYRDPANDLAILKVEGLSAPAMSLGNSDSLKVGQQVIAIGTALGEFRHTVTTGVVSGLGRGIEAGDMFGSSSEALENVIQTDAAINPGNSGGPLLDGNGQVIGVNVAMSAQGQNIGFALPINLIKASLDNFNKTGQFDRPLLGVSVRVITQQAALVNEVPQGVLVSEVVAGSSAEAAGIKAGDIISDFDGKSLKDNDLSKLVNQKKIGDRVKVKIWRDGAAKELDVTLKGQ